LPLRSKVVASGRRDDSSIGTALWSVEDRELLDQRGLYHCDARMFKLFGQWG
jgi:hypothetical protein